jgi:hypothetical protein
MRRHAIGLLVLALLALAGSGCDTYGSITDLDGQRPAKLEGTIHVSWSVQNTATYEPVACSAAGARYVLVVLNADSTHTFRMPCDLPSPEAWIPAERGAFTVRAELVDGDRHPLSKTPDFPLTVQTNTDELTLPLTFELK